MGIVYANSLTAVFICNKKLLQNFLLHINRSTRDVHSRERKNVPLRTHPGVIKQ